MAQDLFEFSDLDKFARVAELGSFVRAATELGISQPALSKSIAKLERKVGVKLLERRARGVVPSAYGEVLLKSLLPALADLNSAMQDIDSMKGGKGGVVSIGASPSVAGYFLPKVIERILRSKRQISLSVTEGLVEELLEKVMSGKFDFAITTKTLTEQPDELIFQNLFRDTFVVCCGAAHPLARRKEVTARELCDRPWVLAPRRGVQRREFEKSFRKQGVNPPSAVIETSSGSLSKSLVIEQGFLSLLPRELIAYEQSKGDIVEVRVAWLAWDRQISLVRRRGKVLSGAENFVIGLLGGAAKSLPRAQGRAVTA